MQCPNCKAEQKHISEASPCGNCGYPLGQTRQLDAPEVRAAEKTLIFGTGNLPQGMDIELEIDGWPGLVKFELKRTLKLGRGPEADVNFELYTDALNLGLSRNHASLHRLPGGVTIQDNMSTNGTWIGLPENGGEKLTPLKFYEVKDGMDLVLGHLKIIIYFARGKANAGLVE